jgi:hypothetical protein
MSLPGENLKDAGPLLSVDQLFSSVRVIEEKLGREPKACEYIAEGEYSATPFKDRFGAKWSDTLAHYRKWKAEGGAAYAGVANSSVRSNTASSHKPRLPVARTFVLPQHVSDTTPIQLYGEPFDFRGLRHAPINEQGVVYLFGMVSRELGFYVESVQQGFPDCEAKYLHDAKKNLWARARIEFEFKASSFKEHGHDPNGCDLIICWINDWPECPLARDRIESGNPKTPVTIAAEANQR